MGRMSGNMVKQEQDGGLTVVPVDTNTNSMLTVSSLPKNPDHTFLYPVCTQGCMTSSLSVYCAVSSQSSLILSPNSLRPELITSPLPQDNLVTPRVIGQIQSVQFAGNSLINSRETKEVTSKSEPLSPLVDINECRWLNCTTRFVHLDDLVNHVNDQHVKVERPDVDYQCRWTGCPRQGRGFNARYKMLIHVRTHTNEKPHKCSMCGKCFSRLENLKIHNRSHTGEKPYSCPFQGCNKAYSNSSDRFKHVRTHQEEKPYICKMPGCNKRYTDPSSLRKHVRTHKHHVKEDFFQSSQDVSPPDTNNYINGQVITLAPVLNFTTIKANGDTKTAVNKDLTSETTPQQIVPSQPLSTITTPSFNLMSFSPTLLTPTVTPATSHVADILPQIVAAMPSTLPTFDGNSTPSEGDCQDRPLDLSRSPVSHKTSFTQVVAD